LNSPHISHKGDQVKLIPLKTVTVELDGKPTRISYKAQLIEIIKTPSDGRLADYEEVRKSIRLLDILAEAQAEQELSLEDADHAYLAQRVNALACDRQIHSCIHRGCNKPKITWHQRNGSPRT